MLTRINPEGELVYEYQLPAGLKLRDPEYPDYFYPLILPDGSAVLVLEDQADRLRLERVRRDFVANVSHEVRTPLASVRLLIETLLNGALDEPELAARMLNQMLGEVDSITQLAQELLDLSMIESGQMPMQMTRVDLPRL